MKLAKSQGVSSTGSYQNGTFQKSRAQAPKRFDDHFGGMSMGCCGAFAADDSKVRQAPSAVFDA
ncbi:MAG: hypothetical protein ACOY5G_10865 [Pseudomonadota bacterium]